MTTSTSSWLLWTPRVLGVAIALFLAVFALDSFERGVSRDALPDFALHLVPALLAATAVALAWRWPWLGGMVFVSLAGAYALIASGHPDWLPVIAGPLLVVGLLFFWSWRSQAV